MSDLVLAIRLTADGKGLVGEVRGSAEELKKLGDTAQQSNDRARTAADQFVASLKRQADTLGMTKAQTQAYEASQHQLTQAQRDGVAHNILAIQSHERQEAMLNRVKTAAFALGAAITTALIVALKSSVTEAARAEQAHLKLEAVLAATRGAAGLNKVQLDAEAEALKRRTGFDDDQIRSSMALMLTFKQVQGDTFGQAMVMATNLSKLIGQDLQSSVLMLGKALEDPESGLLALRRAGVSFSDAQKEAIKDMVAFGDQAGALTMMLRIMREQGLEGVAETMNSGYVGAMNSATNATSDFLKMIGNMTIVKGAVTGFLESFANNLTDIKNVMESGDWVDNLALLTLGYITPSIVARRGMSGDYTGGREARLAREGTQGLLAERQKSEQEDMRDSGIAQAMGLTPRTGEGWTKLNEFYAKQHQDALNKLAEAEKKLQEKGLAGWIAYADAVFNEAFARDKAQAATFDEDNKRATTLEQELADNQNRFNATLAQAIKNIELQNMTEMELVNQQWAEKQSALNAALGYGLMKEEEHLVLSAHLFSQHQKQKTQIAQMEEESRLSGAMTALGNLGSLMSSHNRAAFEVGKTAAIGQTLIATYLGAQRAFSDGAQYSYWLGAAYAAAATIGGLMQVQKIRSTSFDGGGGGAAAVYSANPNTGVPDSLSGGTQSAPPSLGRAAAPRTQIDVTIVNERSLDTVDVKEVVERWFPALQEAFSLGADLRLRLS